MCPLAGPLAALCCCCCCHGRQKAHRVRQWHGLCQGALGVACVCVCAHVVGGGLSLGDPGVGAPPRMCVCARRARRHRALLPQVGFAGNNFPEHIFPSMVGRPLMRFEEEFKDVQLKVQCGGRRRHLAALRMLPVVRRRRCACCVLRGGGGGGAQRCSVCCVLCDCWFSCFLYGDGGPVCCVSSGGTERCCVPLRCAGCVQCVHGLFCVYMVQYSFCACACARM